MKILGAALLAAVLAGTEPWEFPADIVAEQYGELRGWFEREIRDSLAAGGPAASREEFRKRIGAIDQFLPVKARREELGRLGRVKVSLVDWPVLRLGLAPSTSGSA
ncbi:MAG: hypothetical protein NTY38_16515, partial [Acidobacteria bacterium]|nr:hypothetical protein [Acidobacteriota bacterium]